MAKFLDGIGLTDLLNKIKNAFVAKADTTAATAVNIDSTPTANSTNLVTSGGVAAALENIPSTYAGSPSAGGPANKTLGIPYGEVDSDSTATNIKASVDNFPTTLVAGVCAYIRNDVVASASGWTLNINGTGAKPVYASNADASRVTTLFSAATTFLFVYNPTRVSGGCWDMYYGYNANDNTVGYMLRTNGAVPPTASKFYRYRLLFTSDDCQSLIPANTSSSTSATAAKAVNQAKINPFAPIYYYSTTTAINANSAPGAAYSWLQYSGIALGYSFNRTGAELTMTAKDPVFLKCAPQADGSAIMDADNPIVQALPSTEDGKIYIYLGIAESATAITLYYWHPIYYYKDGAMRVWTNAKEIVVDSTPTQGSTNPITSGGVYATLADKADDSDVVHVTGDETIEGDKKFFDDVIVSNQAQGTDGEATIELQASSSSIAAHKYYSAETAEDFSWINWSGTYSPFPPGPGAEPVTHTKTLQQALNERNNPTIDSTPTSGSTNPVSSGGMKTALDSCAKKNQIVAEFDLSSADPTIGTITSGSYSSIIQGIGNGDVPTLHIIIKNNGVVVTSTTTNLITNDYTYSFNNNSYTSLLFGRSYYVDSLITTEKIVVFHDDTNNVDCVHGLLNEYIDPANESSTVTIRDDQTIEGQKTFTSRPNFNDSIFIDNKHSTARNHGVIITYDDSTTLGVSGETDRLTLYGPNDNVLLSGLRDPESDSDASNKAYVDTSTRATRYEPTQETPYLAIRLGATDQQSVFITAGVDAVTSSFYVVPTDNDCTIIGDFDETDLVFSYADGISDFGYTTALLINSNYGSAFNVFNLGSEKMDVKLVSSSGLEIGEFSGQILRWQNKLTFDSVPTANSTNPVSSGGVYTALIAKYEKPRGGIPATDIAAGVIPTVDTNPTSASTNAVSSGGVYSALANKANVVTVGSSMPSGGFLPNVYYSLGTVSGSVTWTLAASSSVADEYMIQFSTGSTAPTITWPSGITWFGGSAPTINANKTYQVSIQNNLAICGEF